MEYGVFTSPELEIAQTRRWALCFYCNSDKSRIGAKLYRGTDDDKKLVAVAERDLPAVKTVYAFQSTDGSIVSNDREGVGKLIGSSFSYQTNEMKKNDSIVLTDPYEMATVENKGIEYCLKQWRMGTSFARYPNGFTFLMATNKIEYVFTLQTDNCDIYCGASVNIPFEKGLFGGRQYFRLRNFGDNSEPFCGFFCHLGNDITVPTVPEMTCDANACIVTDNGIFWTVKRYSNDEIILHGCGDDEYVYRRQDEKSEYFRWNEQKDPR